MKLLIHIVFAIGFALTSPTHAQPQMLTDAPPQFSGAPMSMDFPKIELRTALQLIADFSGVNMVVADSVSGTLSLRLHQVPWDQVLHTVLQTKGLGQHSLGGCCGSRRWLNWPPEKKPCWRVAWQCKP